jgi:hypothetical protein
MTKTAPNYALLRSLTKTLALACDVAIERTASDGGTFSLVRGEAERTSLPLDYGANASRSYSLGLFPEEGVVQVEFSDLFITVDGDGEVTITPREATWVDRERTGATRVLLANNEIAWLTRALVLSDGDRRAQGRALRFFFMGIADDWNSIVVANLALFVRKIAAAHGLGAVEEWE